MTFQSNKIESLHLLCHAHDNLAIRRSNSMKKMHIDSNWEASRLNEELKSVWQKKKENQMFPTNQEKKQQTKKNVINFIFKSSTMP